MSDNPDEIRVGVEADDAGFNDLNQQIDAIADHLNSSSARAQASIGALANKFDALLGNVRVLRQDAAGLADSFNATKIGDVTQVAKTLDDTIAHISISAKAARDEITQLGGAESLRQANLGYGVEGGQIGPAAPTAPGSLYGAGRAFSAGGELARNIGGAGAGDALAGVGQIIRFEEGVQQLGPYLKTLNESLEISGGLIPQLTAALVGAEVPMAGLIGSLLPIAGVAAAAGAAILILKNRLDEGKEAVDSAIDRQNKYHEALLRTPRELEDEIDSLTDKNVGLNDQIKQTQVQLGNLYASRLQSDGSFLGNAQQSAGILLEGLGSTAGSLTESITKLNAEMVKNKEQVEADRDALEKLNNVKIAALVRDEQDDRIQREQDYRQATQLSSKAAQDHINALEEDKKSQAEAVDEIYRMDKALNLTTVEHQKNQDAIAGHLDQLKKDEQGIQDTTKALTNIIGPREREAAAIQAQNEAIQRKIGFMGRETDLIETGSPEQLESYKRSLRNQLAAQQYEVGQIQGRGKDTTPEDQARLDSLKASIKDTVDELARLELVIGPIVETNKALKDMAKAAEDFDKASESIATNLTTQRANARAREADAEKQYMAGSLQDIEARYQIALKNDRAETELHQRTSDAIIDILTKREQKISDINLDFARQAEDDTIKARDEAEKIQTDAHRQERDDLADHLNRIAEINRDAFADEKQALYDRNFLQFAKVELQRQTDLADEDGKFQQKRGKVAERLKQDEEDLVDSLNNQAEQRQRDYERKLADAETASQREIAQQNTNEQRKLAALRQSEADQINDLVRSQQYKTQILQQGLQQELQLYAAQAAARIRLAAQERDAITAQSQNTLDIINAFTASQRASNTTQAVYPWQTAPSYNSTTNNQFNPSFNVTSGQSRQYAEADVSHEFERFANGVFR